VIDDTGALIDPEAVPPAPQARPRRLAVLAALTTLAVAAGGIAMAAGGGRSEPTPFALMAGNAAGPGAESMAARSGSPAPAFAPAQGTVADSKAAIYPYGGWGMKFEVEGRLPELPDHAAAWRVNGPAIDRASVVRIADALGVTGEPVQRDGFWFVDDGDRTLSVNGDPSGQRGPWSISLNRNRFTGANNGQMGPAISPAEGEQRVRDLLDRMGAPASSWKVETTETEIGVGWACAAPAPAPQITPEELTKLEAEKLRQVEPQSSAANSSSSAVVGPTSAGMPAPDDMPAAASKPAPDSSVSSCPPPPPPVKGFTVAFFPLLDGRQGDWPVWNVTLRSDGRIENLYGSWVTFERAGNYKLRGVETALKDLQSSPVAYATDLPTTSIEPATPPRAETSAGGVVEGSAGASASAASGSAASPMALPNDVGTSPTPDIAPCPPVPVPDGKVVSSPLIGCAPPAPQIVKITGVELGLVQVSVFEDGQVRLALVPSYRFTGHFDNGSPWSTSVIALHPDAIAPPPDFPVSDDVRSGGGGGATGVGKAVPPPPPAAEPGPDSSS